VALDAALHQKDKIMKGKYLENGLALLGAILILVAVSAAANTALAGDGGTLEFYSVARS
jgi:hypothetical protein